MPLSHHLFGSHVARRPDDRPRVRQPLVLGDPAGEAEIGQMRLAIAIEQDVARFQVAVQDATLMGMVDGLRKMTSNSAAACGRR